MKFFKMRLKFKMKFMKFITIFFFVEKCRSTYIHVRVVEESEKSGK